jgi:PilZ domain
MTRRESVRVILFARGTLIGADRSMRCALVNLSAAGALLTFTGRLPSAPLRLEFELGGETLGFPVEIRRLTPEGAVALEFPRPYSEQLYRLIAAEQRRGLAEGRLNISERRVSGSSRFGSGEAARRPNSSGS